MGATGRVRVVLVEDHAAFRQALAFLLSHEADLKVVAQAGSLAEARRALAGGRLEVAVLDLALPDGEGTGLIGELRRRNPGVSVLVPSAAMGPGDPDEVVENGADAVLDKAGSPSAIAYEVRRLAGGQKPSPGTSVATAVSQATRVPAAGFRRRVLPPSASP